MQLLIGNDIIVQIDLPGETCTAMYVTHNLCHALSFENVQYTVG